MQGLGLTTVHDMDLAGFQGVGPRIGVCNAEDLDFIKVGFAFPEVIGIAGAEEPHPGLPGLQYHRSGTDALFIVCAFGALRDNRNVIVTGDKGEVCIPFFKGKDNRMLAVGLDVGDRIDNALGRRFGVRPPVLVKGIDHIVGIHGFAIMKFDPFAQLESPYGCIRGGFPGFGQLGNRLALIIDFYQHIADGIIDHLRHGVRQCTGIHGIGGGVAGRSDDKPTALFGRCFCGTWQ